MKTNHFFWFLIVPVVIMATIFISLSPWLAELFATPADRVFSGINRWSSDYYIYLSYVEQGKRGIIPVKLLFTTMPHAGLYTFLSYTIPGFIFGKLLGLSSIFVYHFIRTIYGSIFLLASFIFFYKISKNKLVSLLAFFLSFYISGFVKITSLVPFQATRYLEWLQEQNIIGRATGPIHYSTGMIIFILTFIFFFYYHYPLIKKAVIFGILLNLLLLTNPFNYLVMAISFSLYCLYLLFKNEREKIIQIMTVFFGFLLTLPVFFYINYHLSFEPWGPTSVSPKFFVITTPPISLLETAFSIGPIFFLSIIGILLIVKNKFKNLNKNVAIFLIFWPLVQILLLLFGNLLKIHPPRAFSGLYYLPLGLFSAIIITEFSRWLAKKINIRYYVSLILITVTLFIITLPNYYLSYREMLFSFTDFKNFATFSYPSKKQVEAFKFLEKNAPNDAGVLALYEASWLIMGFSGNPTEAGMSHNDKLPFYSNQMTNEQARNFLIKNRINYVYYGYQEMSAGGNPNNYPFLKKVFNNEETSIYKVI